jgi:hypothetical protein
MTASPEGPAPSDSVCTPTESAKKEIDENSYKTLANWLFKIFVSREDTYAEQRVTGYIRIEHTLTLEVLEEHLSGKITAGTYQIEPKNQTVKWLCFDIDPERTKDPRAIAYTLAGIAREAFTQDSVLVEASRWPDPSFHVWVLFEPPIKAKIARFLGQKLLSLMKDEGRLIELFPKQESVGSDGFGSLVKIPLAFHQREKKWSCFIDTSTGNKIDPNELMKVVHGCSLPDKDLAQIPEEEVTFKRGPNEEAYVGENPPCIKRLFLGVSEGQRNEYAIRLASYLINFKKLPEDRAEKILKEWNEKNKPPLDKEELRNIIKSATQGEYIFGCNDEILSGLGAGECSTCLLKKTSFDPEIIEEANQIIRSEDPLRKVQVHLDNIIAGETQNKKTLFTLLLSGKTTDPTLKQMILIKVSNK